MASRSLTKEVCLLNDQLLAGQRLAGVLEQTTRLSTTYPCKPGSCHKSCTWYESRDLRWTQQPCPQWKPLEKSASSYQMPPSFMPTLYKNDEAFCEQVSVRQPRATIYPETAGYFWWRGLSSHYSKSPMMLLIPLGIDLVPLRWRRCLTGHDDIVEAAVIGNSGWAKRRDPHRILWC